MKVLELSGPEFLEAYVIALAVAVGIALAARVFFCRPGGEPDARTVERLEGHALAYLAGGHRGAFNAAVASACHAGWLQVRGRGGTDAAASRAERPPRDAPSLEAALWRSCSSQATPLSRMRRAVHSELDAVKACLQALGLVPATTDVAFARGWALAAMGAVMAVGVAKLVVGMNRDKPVGLLLALLLVSLAGLLLLLRQPNRTRRGSRALDMARDSRVALRPTAGSKPEQLAPNEIALAVGLFGAASLGGSLDEVRTALGAGRDRVASASASCAAGSGGFGGGCGGGGCGGGGCGGCGGCGG